MKPLSIGLLVDDELAENYVSELVDWAKDQPLVSIACMIVHRRPPRGVSRLVNAFKSPRAMYELVSRLMHRLLRDFESLLLRRSSVYGAHVCSFDLRARVPVAIEIEPVVSASGHVFRFSPEDVSKVRAMNLDVLIRCGGAILRGDILHAARFGILSFHHGDNLINRGGPPGFWEVMYRWPQTGFVLQQLTEELDAGRVLFRGTCTTQFTYLLNQAHVFRKASPHLYRILLNLARTRELPLPLEHLPYAQRLFKAPALHQSLGYCCRIALRMLLKLARRLTRGPVRWNITLAKGGWRSLVLWRTSPVSLPAGHFWADPFLVSENGRLFCLFEDFVYAQGRGRISAIEYQDGAAKFAGVAISEPFHLSFPFVFRYDGALYLCPESRDASQIRIYRCNGLPLDWEHVATLQTGRRCADSMIFEHNSRWWLFTNIEESGTEDFTELYAFHADSPLSTEWTAHPMNPLKVDAIGGRNGGLIRDGDRLFRLGQRQGYDAYGAGLQFYEIRRLDQLSYEEALIHEIGPAYRAGLAGVHHLSSEGGFTAFDHVSRAFVGRDA